MKLFGIKMQVFVYSEDSSFQEGTEWWSNFFFWGISYFEDVYYTTRDELCLLQIPTVCVFLASLVHTPKRLYCFSAQDDIVYTSPIFPHNKLANWCIFCHPLPLLSQAHLLCHGNPELSIFVAYIGFHTMSHLLCSIK